MKVNWKSIGLLVLLIGALSFLHISCEKNFDKIIVDDWNPSLAFPFIESVVSLADLLKSDSTILINNDSSIKVVYNNDSLFGITAGEVFEIPQQQLKQIKFAMGDINFSDFSLHTAVTINDFLVFLDPSIRDSLLKYDGKMGVFPPINLGIPVLLELEPIEDFARLQFSDGKLVYSLKNNLPVVLEYIKVGVLNGPQQDTLATFELLDIAPGDSAVDVIDLKGLEIFNDFAFRNEGIKIQSSFPDSVLIDLSNGLEQKVNTLSLRVASGEAKISSQIVLVDTAVVDFNVENQMQLKTLSLNTARFDYGITSQLPVQILLNLRLLSALQYGEIPEQIIPIPAQGTYGNSWNLDQTLFDLSLDPSQPYNRFQVEYLLLLQASENMVSFDSSNRISLDFVPENLDFEYADGYLGQQTFDIDQGVTELNIDFFNHFEGSLNLTDPHILILYTNSMGIPLNAKIDMKGISRFGDAQALNMDTLQALSPAHIGEVYHGSFLIDKTNSSIIDFISIMPSNIEYGGQGITNPAGITTNFVTKESEIKLGVEIDLPLSLKTNNLLFVDTVMVNMNENDIKNIEGGAMHFLINNGFPFEINLEYVILSPDDQVPVEIYTFNKISPAPVDESGRVTQSVQTLLEAEIDNDTFHHLKSANHCILRSRMITYDSGQVPVVLYTSYSIGIKIGIELDANL